MRKSLWSPDEDEKLRRYVATHGCGNWSDVAKHTGLHRCGKSCRLRWINYLRPDLKRGPFSAHEVRLVVNLHNSMGNSWSKIATHLPGRTDNDVKNFWHSYTRSRRIQQQQQHAGNISHQNSEVSTNTNDQKACSSHEQYHSSDIMHRSMNEEGHMIMKSQNYEGLRQLQHPLNQPANSTNINIKGVAAANYIEDACKSVNNAAQVYLNACKPTDPYAALNALSHTNMSSICFDEPNHIVNHNHHITNPLINLDTKPISITHIQPHSNEEAALSAFYKGFQPHTFNNPCSSTGSSITFQRFPPLTDASDHRNIINSLPSNHANDIGCTVKLKCAVITNSNSSRISPLTPHEKSHNPLDYPAASFHSARTLPANHKAIEDEAIDIKPPEGLQSVIWSFLNGQPDAIAAADVSDIGNYNKSQYVASNHHHHYHNHMIKPQLTLPDYLSSDHPPLQQLPSDQYINAEAFSCTSPSNLQCLQAQYLADCFS